VSETDANTLTTVEHDGRMLSGVGVSEESLQETMDRHTPEPTEEPASPAADASPAIPRNEQGQFQKPTRGHKRIEQLTGEREAERRQREAVEKERDDLRAQLAAAKSPSIPTPAITPDRPTPTPAQSTATAVEKAAMPAHLKTYDAYLEQHPQAEYEEFRDDRNLWLLDSRQTDLDARIRTSIEADRASRSRDDQSLESVKRGRAAYADFDAVLKGATHFQTDDWPTFMGEAIVGLAEPEHVFYQLAKDRALADRLKTLDPVRFGMELSKLVTPVAVASTPASTARTVAHPPPAPYQPVAGGGSSTVPSSAQRANQGDYDFDKSGYREARARERGVRSR
jgi:hypothetical protein